MDYLTQKKARALLGQIKLTSKTSIEKDGVLTPTATFFREDGKAIIMELEETVITRRILLLSLAFDAVAVGMAWETDNTIHATIEWRDEFQKVNRLYSERIIERDQNQITVSTERLKSQTVTTNEATVRGSRPSQREIDAAREIVMAQTPLNG